MVFLVALGLALAGPDISPAETGIYVTSEDYVMTVISPTSIWATWFGRFHTAYGFTHSDANTISGQFDASPSMQLGYDSDPQIAGQYDLLNADLNLLPPKLLAAPAQIPCVPHPADPPKNATGTVVINPDSQGGFHIKWTYAAGNVDYSGNAKKIGDSSLIDLNGVYGDNFSQVSLSEQGTGDARVLIGTATINKKKYRLDGLRIWGRGSFTLTDTDLNSVYETGWLEWAPTSRVVSRLRAGKPISSDQILFYVDSPQLPIGTSPVHRFIRIRS